jgi:RAB protein geranylgeranyltransferase component A
MKFLRFVLRPEDEEEPGSQEEQTQHRQSLRQALEQRFNVPDSLQTPILGLSLSPEPASSTNFDLAVQRIQRHAKSVGYFGPGFGAVIAKYGGNAEIAQVACRAQAVGGGVYLLGHGIDQIERPDNQEGEELLQLTLSSGTQVRCRKLVGSADDLPNLHKTDDYESAAIEFLRSVDIVSDPLKPMFPPTSDNVIVETSSSQTAPPVYLQIHSEDTGECPPGRCEFCASPFHVLDSKMIQF